MMTGTFGITMRGKLPVTAKLSRKFCDQLGDEIASELVEQITVFIGTVLVILRAP